MKWYRLEGVPDSPEVFPPTIGDGGAFVELPKSARKPNGGHMSRRAASSDEALSSLRLPWNPVSAIGPSENHLCNDGGLSGEYAASNGLIVKHLSPFGGPATVSTSPSKLDLPNGSRLTQQRCLSPTPSRTQRIPSPDQGLHEHAVQKFHALDTSLMPTVTDSTHSQSTLSAVTSSKPTSHQVTSVYDSHRTQHESQSVDDLWQRLKAIDLHRQGTLGDKRTDCTCSQLRSLGVQSASELSCSTASSTFLPPSSALHEKRAEFDDIGEDKTIFPDHHHGRPGRTVEEIPTRFGHVDMDFGALRHPDHGMTIPARDELCSEPPAQHVQMPSRPTQVVRVSEKAVNLHPTPQTMVPVSLQDSFRQRMASFIARSKGRQARIANARCRRLRKQAELSEDIGGDSFPPAWSLASQRQPTRHPPAVERLHRPAPRRLDRHEMIQVTKARCAHLPEVKRKALELRKEEEARRNRLRAKVFQRRVTQKALADFARRQRYW